MSQATSDGGVFPLNKPRYSYPNRHGWGPNINKKIPQGKNNKGDLPMKKNTMMRIASCLLIAVLMTTCVISGTFAKYTTESTGNDDARVAHWGFEAPTSLDFDLFKNSYTNVLGEDDADVVAPGTDASDTFSFVYSQNDADSVEKPEVAYTFTVAAAASGDYTLLDLNPNFTWTLKKTFANGAATDTPIGGGTFQTVDALINAIENLDGTDDAGTELAAGNLPTAFENGDEVYTIGWNWTFETATDNVAYVVNTTLSDSTAVGTVLSPTAYAALDSADQDLCSALNSNQLDTLMGNADALDDVTITITITATQKD